MQPQTTANAKKPPQPAPAKKAAKKKPGTAIAVHKPKPPVTLLQMLAQAVVNPRADKAKMELLLRVRQEEEDFERKRQFYNDLMDAKAELPNIVKDKQGDRKIRYASLENVSNSIDGILARHNMMLTFGQAVDAAVNVYRVTGLLMHRSGHSRDYSFDVPESITGPAGKPIMTKMQGAGAAVTYGRRQIKMMVMDITVADQDTDGAAQTETISSDELLDLNEKMKAAKVDTDLFCKHFGIEAVPDLPKARLAEALRLIKQKMGGE